MRQVAYRLPETIEAIAQGKTIFVTEGEKCVDAVIELGAAATCNAMGAGKFPDEIVPAFKGADVVILPDNDEPGARHAALVAQKLRGTGTRVRILKLPDLPPKGDVVDWTAAGGTASQLCTLADAAALYVPTASSGETDPFITAAMHHNKDATAQKPPARFTGAATFMRSYEPISYSIDSVLPSSFLYGLTAKQGSGKTALMIAATIAVIKGDENILGCEVEKGRVAYVTIENPVDFKMKLAVNCHTHFVSYNEAEPLIAIIDGRDTPEQIYEGLKLDAEENGPFQLVCFDTFKRGSQRPTLAPLTTMRRCSPSSSACGS